MKRDVALRRLDILYYINRAKSMKPTPLIGIANINWGSLVDEVATLTRLGLIETNDKGMLSLTEDGRSTLTTALDTLSKLGVHKVHDSLIASWHMETSKGA